MHTKCTGSKCYKAHTCLRYTMPVEKSQAWMYPPHPDINNKLIVDTAAADDNCEFYINNEEGMMF